MTMLEKARAALETASDKILADYRTWIADDTEAKPRYGQIPEYDKVNASIGEIDRHIRTITPAEAGGLVEWLRERAKSYRMGGPSSEHTATLLDEAATALAAERAAHAETKRERDDLERRLCAAEHGHTANDVLANYREVRRYAQDARAARRALTGGKEDG